jgi:adenine-specific DNA-methyltransferase
MRSALVDYFQEQGQIMIATEAGAEGINLQFCSLVVNYDLPWNPQRIEQRIGRCHRYGQKHDVVVVNFLNRKNAADRRVYQLLSEKFQLFEGVFGASDEVLGAIESGVDFEKRINDIYQRCRKHDEIKTAFDQLQLELSFEINEAMTRTKQNLLENFDDDVRNKLRVRDAAAREFLDRYEQLLMRLSRYELDGYADFLSDHSFKLHTPLNGCDIPPGLYELPRRSREAHTYRLSHPLAEAVIERAKKRDLPLAEIRFDYDAYVGKISALQPLRGRSGYLSLSQVSIDSLDQAEDYLIFAAVTDNGETLDEDIARRLLSLPGEVGQPLLGTMPSALEKITEARQTEIRCNISERNARFFEIETEKLDGWADDLKIGLEREIKELDRQIKEARRAATAALTLEEKLAGQKQVKALESQRNAKRRALFDAQDDIDRRREQLIAEIERKLQQKVSQQKIFSLRWRLS